jgi:hypothetical protein
MQMTWKLAALASAMVLVISAPVWAEEGSAAAMQMPSVSGGDGLKQLADALRSADGSVDLVIGVDPGPEKLGEILNLLSVSTADQIRLSVLYDPETLRVTAEQKVVLAVVRDYIAVRGLDWYVCEGWWGTPGREDLSRRVAGEFGGSLLFIDNGSSSDLIDNPSADLIEALENDPAFASVFDQPQRLTDGEPYWNAVEAFWSQVMLDNELDHERRGGWKDGC